MDCMTMKLIPFVVIYVSLGIIAIIKFRKRIDQLSVKNKAILGGCAILLFFALIKLLVLVSYAQACR